METESEKEGHAPAGEAKGAENGAKPVAAERTADLEAEPKAPAPSGRKIPMAAQIDDLFAAVRRLETFAADEAKRVSGKLVPTVEERAKKNIWFSLLLALGLGLILGIWITGGRRRE